MSDEKEIRKFLEFMESEHDCKCMDGSFEDFDRCCGKKFGIVNPVNTLFKIVNNMSNKCKGPRLKDLDPEQSKKIFNTNV